MKTITFGIPTKTKTMAKSSKKSPQKSNSLPFSEKRRTIYLIFAIFTFLLYANSLGNDYALDDTIVIKQNTFVKRGASGIPDIFKYDTFTGFFGETKELVAGGRYRPLSLATFAIEIEMFGKPEKNAQGQFTADKNNNRLSIGNPTVSHFVNLLLYLWTAVVLYQVLVRMFKNYEQKTWYLSLPFVITLLFIAHPLHTEAVANIKGRDEIMTMLGSLYALKFTFDFVMKKERKYLAYSAIALFLGLLSKENAITFLAVVPFALFFFTELKWKEIFAASWPLLAAAAVFMLIRQSIIGFPTTNLPPELMNNPYLNMNAGEKFATIMYTLGLYIKLMFFPHPLTFDYYPYHIPIIKITDWQFLLSIAVYLGLAITALLTMRKKSVYAFAIILFLATLSVVSNLFFPVGVFMNERFVYISSLGWCIAAGYFVLHSLPKWMDAAKAMQVSRAILLVVLVGFSFKTISRNPDWKDDETLFLHDIKISKNSAKGNVTAGGTYVNMADGITNDPVKKRETYLQAIAHLEHALEIHPRYKDAMLLLGNAWFKMEENYEKTLDYYMRILQLNPNDQNVHQNLGVIFNKRDNYDLQIETFLKVHALAPNRSDVCRKLATLYGKHKQDIPNTIIYLEKAYAIDPTQPDVMKDLGVSYAALGQYDKAMRYFKEAEKFVPQDKQNLMNIALTYDNMGQPEMAQTYRQKAQSIK